MKGINLTSLTNKIKISDILYGDCRSFSIPITRVKKWGKIHKNASNNMSTFMTSSEDGYDWTFRAKGLWHDVRTDYLLDYLCPYKVGETYFIKESWIDVNYFGCPAIMYSGDYSVKDLSQIKEYLDENGAVNYEHPNIKKYDYLLWFEDVYRSKKNWRRSNHMLEWASRLNIKITNISVDFYKQYNWKIDFEISLNN